MFGNIPRRPGRSQRGRAAAPARRRAPRDISRLEPSSQSRETVDEASRRRSRTGKILSPIARRRRRRRIALVVLSVSGLLLLATVVAGFAYVRSIGNQITKVATEDPRIHKALDPPPSKPGEPFYMVLMGSDTRRGQKQQRSDTLIVARIDPKNKKVAMISIPRDSRVSIPGYGNQKVNAAVVWGGPALAIRTVKELTGLPVSRYANIDFRCFRDVVDAIGGVWIDVPFSVYDTKASAYGPKYATLKKGYQKLDGRHALTFVRTRHMFADGDFQRMRNQQAFVKALAGQTLSLANIFNATAIMNAVAANLDTNMTPAQLIDLMLQFKGAKAEDIETFTAPGAPSYVDGVSYVVLDDVKLDEAISRMRKGLPLDPSKAKERRSGTTTGTVSVKPADVSLTVRNGAGVSGLGKQGSDFLTSKGFKVRETGNMAQFVYDKTLVIYHTGALSKANFVRESLGFGNVISAASMYTFNTPVMVVVGKDWKNPTASTARQ